MNETPITAIYWLLNSSVILVAFPVFWILGKKIIHKLTNRSCCSATVGNTLLITAFLCIAVCLYRLTFSLYGKPENFSTIGKKLEWLDSLFVALRTFGMEEGYRELILQTRELAWAICPDSLGRRYALLIYATMLHFGAPLAGGALVFEILANFFPKLMLWGARWVWWRERCYFSQLNASSLALAKSIQATYRKDKQGRGPILIFTDTHVDDEQEKDYELLQEAKKIGAICVRDDLIHVPKPLGKKRSYYLMDDTEFGNLQTLTGLTQMRYSIQKTKIHVFVQSDANVRLEKKVKAQLQYQWSHWPNGKVRELPATLWNRRGQKLYGWLLEKAGTHKRLHHWLQSDRFLGIKLQCKADLKKLEQKQKEKTGK